MVTHTGCFRSLAMSLSPTEILVAGGQTDDLGNMTNEALIIDSENLRIDDVIRTDFGFAYDGINISPTK